MQEGKANYFQTLQLAINQLQASPHLICKRFIKELQDQNLYCLSDKKMKIYQSGPLVISKDQLSLPISFVPQEGQYKKIIFEFLLLFCNNYPYQAPLITCINNQRHLKIDPDSHQLYMDIIDNWRPVFGFLLYSINRRLFEIFLQIKLILLTSRVQINQLNQIFVNLNINNEVAGSQNFLTNFQINQFDEPCLPTRPFTTDMSVKGKKRILDS